VERPVIDAAYVVMPFEDIKNQANQITEPMKQGKAAGTIGCLELCMYAEGSRHQEEIIVTGTKVSAEQSTIYASTKQVWQPMLTALLFLGHLMEQGRLEAYIPENKVFAFERPSMELWDDRSIPPPPSSIRSQIYDCSDFKNIHGIETDEEIPTHGGYHHSSTGVSLEDGMRAVEIGLQASSVIVNED
jgi:hypothetical protein